MRDSCSPQNPTNRHGVCQGSKYEREKRNIYCGEREHEEHRSQWKDNKSGSFSIRASLRGGRASMFRRTCLSLGPNSDHGVSVDASSRCLREAEA